MLYTQQRMMLEGWNHTPGFIESRGVDGMCGMSTFLSLREDPFCFFRRILFLFFLSAAHEASAKIGAYVQHAS